MTGAHKIDFYLEVPETTDWDDGQMLGKNPPVTPPRERHEVINIDNEKLTNWTDLQRAIADTYSSYYRSQLILEDLRRWYSPPRVLEESDEVPRPSISQSSEVHLPRDEHAAIIEQSSLPLSITAFELGSTLAFGSTVLLVLTWLSGQIYIDPLVGVILLIFGVTFAAMGYAQKIGWDVGA